MLVLVSEMHAHPPSEDELRIRRDTLGFAGRWEERVNIYEALAARI